MKITLLCENMVSEKVWDCGLAEWGFSAFIEKDNTKILFDFGTSDVYIKNAKALGIDLGKVDFLVLSHHHNDHFGGIHYHPFKTKKTFITHPDVPSKLPEKDAIKLKQDFEILTSKKPLEFAKDCFYLGQIPRTTDFENGDYEDDDMHDDSALVFKTSKGSVIVTGCSHAGICNICEYAKKVTGQKLYAVIGGFHLFEDNLKAFEGTMRYLEKEKVEKLSPMHCVEFSLLAKMQQKFGFKKYSAGDVINIEER